MNILCILKLNPYKLTSAIKTKRAKPSNNSER